MSAAPLRTLIVDDEPLARRRLEILCRDIEGVAIIGNATNGTDAVDQIRACSPDLVLLDIAMPDVNGLGVVSMLVDMAERPAIVFCTALDSHALAAFEVAAVDYLLKPIEPARLMQAVVRARDIRGRQTARGEHFDKGVIAAAPYLDHLWVPRSGVMRRLDISEVTRIDAEGDYVRIGTAQGSFLLKETLTRLADGLDPAIFIKLRRSLVVRAQTIRGVRHAGLGAWEALLADGEWARIGPTHWKAAKARLMAGGAG